MTAASRLFAELKRRNVLRAGILYIGAIWALAQGISQLGPSIGLPEWSTRWFLVAGVVGFPFWLVFSWLYELTPHGFRRESEVPLDASITRTTGRKLDFAIIGVLAVAVVLLLTDRFVARSSSAAASAVSDKSIAVLPLANEGGDAGQQYFSDGLSEDLITALSQFAGLKVIGRSSSFQFRDAKEDARTIGSRLGVATLLEGSVRHAGDLVRISAELINVADSRTLWSQRYDRPYKDLFALQDEIVQSVAAALKARLLQTPNAAAQGARPPSGNLEAYNAFLQGDFYFGRGTQTDLRKAIEEYTEATRIDPRYAEAWVGISSAWTSLAARFFSDAAARPAYAEARKALDTALALAPDSSDVHQALTDVRLNADLDWHGAEVEAQRALQLAPDDGFAKFNFAISRAALGHVVQAIDFGRQALVTNPLISELHLFLAKFLRGMSRLAEAEAEINKAIELQPNAPRFHVELAAIAAQRGDAPAALAAAQREQPGPWQRQAFAYARAIAASPTGADQKAADMALQSYIENDADTSAFQIAQVYALRRDPDKTFEWLGRAWINRDPGIQYLLYDPFIMRYRDDPRFAAYCAQVGLPIATDANAQP